MVNFIEVLEGIGCFGFWDVVLLVTVNLERIRHYSMEYWSWSGLMKLRDPPFDFVTKMLILPNSGN